MSFSKLPIRSVGFILSLAVTTPVLTGAITIPAVHIGGNTYTQVEANDNGTLSFGAAYLADGPSADFLNAHPPITALIAPGFGDYTSANNWSSAAVANGVRLDFSGVAVNFTPDPANNNKTNTFSVTFFNDGTAPLINWKSIDAPFLIAVGAVDFVPKPPVELLPFNDYSLNGADPVNTLNGTSAYVPEPISVASLTLGAMSLLTRRSRW